MNDHGRRVPVSLSLPPYEMEVNFGLGPARQEDLPRRVLWPGGKVGPDA